MALKRTMEELQWTRAELELQRQTIAELRAERDVWKHDAELAMASDYNNAQLVDQLKAENARLRPVVEQIRKFWHTSSWCPAAIGAALGALDHSEAGQAREQNFPKRP